VQRFILRRFGAALLTLLGITVIVFGLSRMGPDPMLVYVREETYAISPDAVEALRRQWGLDRPIHVQYFVWLGNVLRGDLGRSIASQRPVSITIKEKIGATVQLGVAAWIVATLVGVPLGVLAGVKRASGWEYLARTFALIGQATPSFWLALVVILVFAVQLDLLPSATRAINAPLTIQIQHFILPTAVLAFEPLANYLRLTRSSMLEILDSEFVKLARAKGVGHWTVIWKHALRNALIQPITVSALVLASFITGVVFIETIFAWPGLGRLAVMATMDNDFPVLSGVVLLFGVMYVTLNFGADILYTLVDPRIRYS
jgi:peptide/nickel transport system permease protein